MLFAQSLLDNRTKNPAAFRSLLRLWFFLLSSLFLMTAPSIQAATAAPSSPDWLNQKMNLHCNGRALAEVLEEVADFFDTTLVYQAEGDQRPVWCEYSQVTASEILNRLFQRQNRAILVEDFPERRITVQVFGVSTYNVLSPDGDIETETLPFLSEMTNKELTAMQNAQYELYQQEIKDPNAIIPGLDMTRKELQSLHREQNQQYEKLIADQNQIVAGMSITRQQLEKLHEQQLKKYKDQSQRQDAADPLSGLTPSELKELHQQQLQKGSP